MIKICYVIGQLDKGGAERQLYELLKVTNRKKFDPTVISFSQGGFWKKEIQRLNIDVIEIYRGKKYEFKRLLKLIKLINSLKPDIVHTYLFSANSYGRIAAIIARIPIIITSERSTPDINSGRTLIQIYIDKYLSCFSQGIICNSYKASDILIRKYSFDSQKVYVVHNGIDVTTFLKNKYFDNHKISNCKVIGTVGSLFPLKNHRLFLDMAKIILENYSSDNLKFMIIGGGGLRAELESYAQYLGITSKVVFTGERTDVHILLKSFDIFVMTSLYEGLSNAIMEAMLSNLPVVATDVGGNRELISDGETGFICPSNNANVLADKVLILINDEKKSKLMGEKGKKKIINNFSIEKMWINTEQIYLKFLKQKNILNSQINVDTLGTTIES
jgi:glycosyltransferase involved in cell wall biosynthesis